MRYASIKFNDIANGPGIAVSFFTQGCPHRCKGCFNPETWSFKGGKVFTQTTLLSVLEGLTANGISRHLSILGGEPLCPENLPLVDLIISTIKKELPQTLIYIWTGYTLEELQNNKNTALQNILQQSDFLIDGKFIEEEKDITLKLRGSRNQRIWNLKTGEQIYDK